MKTYEITYEDFLRQIDYNGTSNVSPVCET